MTAHQDVFGFVDTGSQTRRPPVVGMQFLHEGAMRARDVVARSSLLKPQNFIGFILGHRSTAAAMPFAAPRVRLTICCRTPSGKPAVEISL